MLSMTYRTLTDLGAPFIGLYMLKRRAEGREDPKRFGERFGISKRPRPPGRLVWCHAASVGEAASILALIGKIRATYPDTHILVTTWTITSGRMLASRLPEGAFHQYMPVDRMGYVKRFLRHWKPDFALLIESELWPNMLKALHETKIPTALINGRMSTDSFKRWHRFKGWAEELVGDFVVTLTQTEEDRKRYTALGADPVRCPGNLKYTAKPLPVDEAELKNLRAAIGERPLWLFASSHRGEEKMAIEAHQKLRAKWPNLLTIIVPRHAVRGNEISEILSESGVATARRSNKEPITAETEINLADTMGELGLFYRLAPVVALGGSFIQVGGHNPIEPAQLDCAIILGPYMHNFSAIAREFVTQKAAIKLDKPARLAATVERLLETPAERAQYTGAARLLAEQKSHVLDDVLKELTPWLAPKTTTKSK